MIPNPPPVPISVFGASTTDYRPSIRFRKYLKLYFGLGIAQLLMAAIALIASFVMFMNDLKMIVTSLAATAGVTFFCSGIYGIKSGISGRYCPVVASMVLTIFSALMGFNLTVYSSGFMESAFNKVFDSEEGPEEFFQGPPTVYKAILIPTGVIGFFVSLTHSIFCCYGTCCEVSQTAMAFPMSQGSEVATQKEPPKPYTDDCYDNLDNEDNISPEPLLREEEKKMPV